MNVLNSLAKNFEQLAAKGIDAVQPWALYAVLAFSAIELTFLALDFANGRSNQSQFWRLFLKTGIYVYIIKNWTGLLNLLLEGGGWIASKVGASSMDLVKQPGQIVDKATELFNAYLFPELGILDKVAGYLSGAFLILAVCGVILMWRFGSIAFGVMYIIAAFHLASVIGLALLPFTFFSKTKDYFPNIPLGLVKGMVWVTVTYMLLGIIWDQVKILPAPGNKDPKAWIEYVYIVTILTWIFHEVRTGVVDIIFASVTNQRAPNVTG